MKKNKAEPRETPSFLKKIKARAKHIKGVIGLIMSFIISIIHSRKNIARDLVDYPFGLDFTYQEIYSQIQPFCRGWCFLYSL